MLFSNILLRLISQNCLYVELSVVSTLNSEQTQKWTNVKFYHILHRVWDKIFIARKGSNLESWGMHDRDCVNLNSSGHRAVAVLVPCSGQLANKISYNFRKNKPATVTCKWRKVVCQAMKRRRKECAKTRIFITWTYKNSSYTWINLVRQPVFYGLMVLIYSNPIKLHSWCRKIFYCLSQRPWICKSLHSYGR